MNWMDRADKWLKQKYTDWRIAKNQRRQARQLARNLTEKIKLSSPAVALNDKLFREKLSIIDTLKKSVHTLLVETKGVVQRQPEAFERLREALYGVNPQAIHPAAPQDLRNTIEEIHQAVNPSPIPDLEDILNATEPRPPHKDCAARIPGLCPPSCPPCRSFVSANLNATYRTFTTALPPQHTVYFNTKCPGAVDH